MKTEEMSGGDDGGGRAVGQEDEIGNGIAQCIDHPFMVNHGGVCAFCLQEKLGKLVSSSLSLPLRYSTSSSSSPSFRSDYGGAAPSASSLSLSIRSTASKTVNGGGAGGSVYRRDEYYYSGRAWIPFLTAKKKKKNGADVVFKRSKSTTTYTAPRRNRYLDSINGCGDLGGRDRGGFWSFLYLSSSNRQSSKKTDKSFRENSKIVSMAEPTLTVYSMRKNGTIVEEDEALDSSIDRKVSRSRSVGCGSRSFSGDIFERISTGFGDCTLRRVESQRESKPKASQDRVKCGGLFGGFMVASSSSSSSSSSSYWVSSDHSNGSKPASVSVPPPHRRSKSWNWAFASPMRAFSKASSSKDLKKDTVREHSDKNTGSNSSAIPPLMTVRS